jgi:small conductance mechanosensitive channel
MNLTIFLQDKIHALPLVKEVKSSLTEQEKRINGYFDNLLNEAVDFIPRLLIAAILLLLGLWLIRRISKLATRAMEKRELDISLRTFLRSLISIGLKIILIVTVAGMIGIGTTSFVTILGAAGLAVGLALQGSLSNFAGGVLILIFKPFKVGDMIEAAGQTGDVKEIQIFNTIMLTADHKTVILPNGPLSNGTIINYSRQGNLRIDLSFHLDGSNTIQKVRDTVSQVLEKNPLVLKQPLPIVLFSVGEWGALLLRVKPYCLTDDTVRLSSTLYEEIKTAFEQNQIKAAVPVQRL